MSKTFTEQVNLPPAGTPWAADGEGMHSAIPFDLARGLNNLGTYCNNHLHYVQGSSSTTTISDGVIESLVHDPPQERFILEIPVLVPLWAYRLVWVAGAKCVAVSLTAVTLYFAKDPYAGERDDPFNTSLLATGYRSRAVSMSLTAGQYGLADDSSTGLDARSNDVARDINAGIGLHTKRRGYAIITSTGGANATVQLYDTSIWFLPS